MKILIIGGSGLVGGRLLDLLAGSTEHEIKCLLRHSVNERKGIKQRVANVADWPHHAADFCPDVLISTLGTTIAQAGSKAAFAAIDKDLVLAVAEAARGSGARQCIAVSSVGASARSGPFYLRTKGELESALAVMGFDRLDTLRPGLLLGTRGGAGRPAERFGVMLAPLTNLLTPGSLDRYRAIRATAVAAAIAALVGAPASGHFIHHNREMLAFAA